MTALTQWLRMPKRLRTALTEDTPQLSEDQSLKAFRGGFGKTFVVANQVVICG
jgi:hypothetical protein